MDVTGDLSEALPAGILILLLAILIYTTAISTRPDPKMLLLLSLLATLPKNEGESAGEDNDQREKDSSTPHVEAEDRHDSA
jgi:hypothetical protein